MHLAYGYRTAGRRGLGPLHSEHRQAPWLQVIESRLVGPGGGAMH